jgi:hypothetical protein
MGTNRASSSSVRRVRQQIAASGGGAGGVGATASAGAVTNEALGRSTDIMNDPNRPESSPALTRQRANDIRAGVLRTNMERAYDTSMTRQVYSLEGLRNTSTTDLRNISSRLRSQTADLDRLVPQARALLSSGQPLSDLRRSQLIRAFNTIENRLPVMRTNIQRAERELGFRPQA